MVKKDLDYIYKKYGTTLNWLEVINQEKLDAEFIRENHHVIDVDYDYANCSDIDREVIFELSQINRQFIHFSDLQYIHVRQSTIYQCLNNFIYFFDAKLMANVDFINLNAHNFDAKCWHLFSCCGFNDHIILKYKDKVNWDAYFKCHTIISRLIKDHMPECYANQYKSYKNNFYRDLYLKFNYYEDHNEIINWLDYTCYEATDEFLIDRQYDIGHWGQILMTRQLPEDFILSLLNRNLITIYDVIENQYMSVSFFRRYHSLIPWKDKNLKIKSFEHFSLKTIKELLPKWKYNYFREHILQ